jgi:HSP20 family protein
MYLPIERENISNIFKPELERRNAMKQRVKQTLTAIGLLAIIGTVGAESYYTYRLSEKLDSLESPQIAESAPQPYSSGIDFDNPWSRIQTDMNRMQAQMDHMFDAAFNDAPMMGHGDWGNGSRVSLSEAGDNYVVKAEIPGADKSDINVNLNDRLLSLSAQVHGIRNESSGDSTGFHRETYSSSFQQAMTLPGPVDDSGMKSDFKDGVLTVTIPKMNS